MSIREAVVDYGVSKRKIELDTQTREFASIFCGKKARPNGYDDSDATEAIGNLGFRTNFARR